MQRQRHKAFDWNLCFSLPMVKKRQGNFGLNGQANLRHSINLEMR